MAGVDLRTVQKLVGWQTLAMVERYADLTPAHKAQAVEQIALVPGSELRSRYRLGSSNLTRQATFLLGSR